MSKIKEVIENNVFCASEAEGDYEEIANAMKEYAEFYCERFRTELSNRSYHYENARVVDADLVECLDLPEHE